MATAEPTLRCPKCGEDRAVTDFNRNQGKVSGRTNGRNGWCKLCYKNWRLQRTYGITLDDYNRMLEEQNHGCALCGKPGLSDRFPLSVDHCHKTGKVRGLLCISCNRVLGYIDNVKWRRRAVAYIKAARES